MSAFFGNKAKTKTVLLVDIENGSVATALVQLSKNELPKLFAEHRVILPVPNTISSSKLAKKVMQVVDESLVYTSEVAARMRQTEQFAQMGVLSGAQIFLGVPWVTAHIKQENLRWNFEPEMYQHVQTTARSVVGDTRIALHPFGQAAARAMNVLTPGVALVCILTGEVTELLIVENGKVKARATIPVGLHTLLRTLTSHGAMSTAEARSAAKLYHVAPPSLTHLHGPMHAAAEHLVAHFVDAGTDLLSFENIQNIFIIGPDPIHEWFAQTVSSHPLVAKLFPDGGVTRALRSKHLFPHLAAHAPIPDVPLMLEAMFMQSNQKFI